MVYKSATGVALSKPELPKDRNQSEQHVLAVLQTMDRYKQKEEFNAAYALLKGCMGGFSKVYILAEKYFTVATNCSSGPIVLEGDTVYGPQPLPERLDRLVNKMLSDKESAGIAANAHHDSLKKAGAKEVKKFKGKLVLYRRE